MESISAPTIYSCMGMKSGRGACPPLEKVRGQLPPCPRGSAVYAFNIAYYRAYSIYA